MDDPTPGPLGLMRSRKRYAAPVLAAIVVAMLAVVPGSAWAQIKPALHGLVYMGKIDFHNTDGGVPDNAQSVRNLDALPDVFSGVVINATWAQLEPQPNEFSTGVIDQALAAIRSYNAQHPNLPLAVRLRVWGGPNAPEWAKTMGGPPVQVLHRNMPITIGRFWSMPYRQAWQQLQSRLAAKYDSEPLIDEVANSSCASMTDEPFIFAGDAPSLASMESAGFNDADERNCLMDSAADYAGWHATRIEFPFNPYRSIQMGRLRPDIEFTLAVMQHWRQVLGPRGVISSHALQSSPPERLAPIYDYLRRLGPPIELQMFAPRNIDWNGAIQYAVSLGATAVELWPDTVFGNQGISPQALKTWASELQHNPVR